MNVISNISSQDLWDSNAISIPVEHKQAIYSSIATEGINCATLGNYVELFPVLPDFEYSLETSTRAYLVTRLEGLEGNVASFHDIKIPEGLIVEEQIPSFTKE